MTVILKKWYEFFLKIQISIDFIEILIIFCNFHLKKESGKTKRYILKLGIFGLRLQNIPHDLNTANTE